MAISNLGLVLAPTAQDALLATGGSSVRVEDGGPSGMEPFVRWRMMSDRAVNARAHLRLDWLGVPRATETRPDTAYGTTWRSSSYAWELPETGSASKSAAIVRSDGCYECAVALSAIAPSAGLTGSDWSFDARRYDELHFRVSAYTEYATGVTGPDGETVSPTARADAWVGYIPSYSVASVAYDLQGLDIVLNRSGTWARSDDRCCVEALSIGGLQALPADRSVWTTLRGTCARIGIKELAVMPRAAECRVSVRVNAAYKPIGYSLATVSATVEIQDRSKCNTPLLSTSVHGDSVTVRVGDSGDRGSPIARATVKLRGSCLACDTVDVDVGGSAVFRALPPGEATFEAVGAGASSAVGLSRPAAATATVELAVGKIVDLATGEEYEVLLQPGWSWSGAAEMTTVKLSGRDRCSAFYGVGGQATGKAAMSLVGPSAQRDAEGLAFANRCIVKSPDGSRKLVAVTGVSTVMRRWGAEVSIKYAEVV